MKADNNNNKKKASRKPNTDEVHTELGTNMSCGTEGR